jgi:hypothetical protein
MNIERDLAAGDRLDVAVYSFEATQGIAQPDPHIGCHFRATGQLTVPFGVALTRILGS